MYPTYELSENPKKPDLQNWSSMTQGNNRISERRPGEDPVLIVLRKPEASKQKSDGSLQ